MSGGSVDDTERKSVTLNLTEREARLVVNEMNQLLEASCEVESVCQDAQSVVTKVNQQISVCSHATGTDRSEGGADQ